MDLIAKDFILTFAISYIVDLSGIISKLNMYLWHKMLGDFVEYKGWYIPLIGCSRCLTFWSVLAYTFYLSDYDPVVILGIASFCSYISPITTLALKRIIVLLSDCFTKSLNK